MRYWLILLRSLGRKLGLSQLVRCVQGGRPYEDKFCRAILSLIRPGDTVWDIGANVGFYTKLFVDRVGPVGHVVAFEPARDCFDVLTHHFEGCSGVQLENVAMGAQDGEGQLRLGKEPLSPVNQLLSTASRSLDDNTLEHVRIITCDSYWKVANNTPSVIKIDVEGFEEEVLAGMVQLLNEAELRAVFVEVHFTLLEERGNAFAPISIEHTLQARGFCTSWVDWSHIQAVRPSTKLI